MEGSTVDGRRRRGGGDDKWERCVVLKAEEAEDGERLLQLRVASTIEKSNPSGGEAEQEARDVWVSAGGDDVCAEGAQVPLPDDEQSGKSSKRRKGDIVSQPSDNDNVNVSTVGDGNKATPSESRHAAGRVKRVALVGSSGGGAAASG